MTGGQASGRPIRPAPTLELSVGSLVDMAMGLYLRVVAPRQAKDVSIEEFRLWLETQMHPEQKPTYDALIESGRKRIALMREYQEKIESSIEFLTTLRELGESVGRLDRG